MDSGPISLLVNNLRTLSKFDERVLIKNSKSFSLISFLLL